MDGVSAKDLRLTDAKVFFPPISALDCSCCCACACACCPWPWEDSEAASSKLPKTTVISSVVESLGSDEEAVNASSSRACARCFCCCCFGCFDCFGCDCDCGRCVFGSALVSSMCAVASICPTAATGISAGIGIGIGAASAFTSAGFLPATAAAHPAMATCWTTPLLLLNAADPLPLPLPSSACGRHESRECEHAMKTENA